MATRQLSDDTTVNDLGHISRSLDCFTSNFSKPVCDIVKVTIDNYTSFRLVPLLTTLKYIWKSFQPRLSFPRPFQQSLACFRVARSPSNSWASCFTSGALQHNKLCKRWYCYDRDVRPSVCHILVLYQNEPDFFHRRRVEDSNFLPYQVHPEIRKGSPRERTLNEAFKPLCFRNRARQDQACYWSLIGNYSLAFIGYQNQLPWMTMNGQYALLLHYTRFSCPPQKFEWR